MNGLLEILTTKKWMISPDFVHGVRGAIENNLNTHAALKLDAKQLPYIVGRAKEAGVKGSQITADGMQMSVKHLNDMTVPFVNVLPVMGPITRNGDACSYGSKDLRDWLMLAADNLNCTGHVFYIDTPGGSAWAKNDFLQAIDYAHAHNQPVLAFVDGLCASAGMYLAALCDEVYVMHPKDQLGCIGVMAAFYTEKNGTTNTYTNETYHELYDPQSFDKNKWARDIAEDSENNGLLMQELTALGEEFRADILKSFPAATDEHLHGKLFNAEDVYGILCEGQSTLGEVVERVFALHDGTAEPVIRQAAPKPEPEKPEEEKSEPEPEKPEEEKPEDEEPEETPDEQPEKPEDDDPDKSDPSEEPQNLKTSEPQNQNDMNNYEHIARACGVEELVVAEDGAHFMPDMLNALNDTLAQSAGVKADYEQQLAAMQADCEKQIAEANDKAAAAIADAQSNAEKAVAEANANAEKAVADAQTAAKETTDALAKANQTIADQQEQIAALTAAPAAEQHQSPANNGTGTEQPKPACAMPAYDPTKSPVENARIRKEFFDAHK